MFQTKVVYKIKTRSLCSITLFFSKILPFMRYCGKVESDRAQMKIWNMHIACWITNATNTHSEYVVCLFFVFGATALQWAMASSFLRFLDHTQRRTTVGRTPLDEWTARRRDLYLTTHNTHNRQTSMPPMGFEPTVSAGERPLRTARMCTTYCFSTTTMVARTRRNVTLCVLQPNILRIVVY